MDELETRPLGKPAKDMLVHFLPAKRSVERAFLGLAMVVAVIGGVAAWEAWGDSKMYWTDLGIDKIQRVSPDGTGMEDLITTYSSGPMGGGGQRYGIALVTAR